MNFELSLKYTIFIKLPLASMNCSNSFVFIKSRLLLLIIDIVTYKF